MADNRARSFRELMDKRQADAAVAISGAHHSSWNKSTRPLAADKVQRGVAGEAEWHGTIRYNESYVDAPLRQMYSAENVGRYNQDPKTLRSYRQALKTVLHENAHLLAPEGKQYRDGSQAYQSPEVKALEEGVTESWSEANIDRYIDEIGAEQIAPGIKGAESGSVYPHYTPAAEKFAADLGRQSGQSADEVIQKLNNETPDTKFRRAATMVYEASNLRDVPGVDRERAISSIEGSMKPPFAKLEGLKGVDPAMQRRQSALLGADAARQGKAAVLRLGGRPGGPSLDSTRGLQRHTAQVEHALDQTSRPGGRPQALQDLQHTAQVALGASPALSGARQLSEAQFGSRRPGADAGQAAQRQHQNTGPSRT